MPEIFQVTNKLDYDRVCAAALADNHYALAPTHFWTDKHGEISGYFSNGRLQVCHFWMRRDSTPRKSYETILACKDIAKATNPMIARQGQGIIACAESSPFFPFMERKFKFKPITRTVLFLGEA